MSVTQLLCLLLCYFFDKIPDINRQKGRQNFCAHGFRGYATLGWGMGWEWRNMKGSQAERARARKSPKDTLSMTHFSPSGSPPARYFPSPTNNAILLGIHHGVD